MPLLAHRQNLEKSSRHDIAPLYDENNIPYNYIIIIDAGSKGTRAYVYSYKSMKYYLQNNITLNDHYLPHLIYSHKWHKRIKPSIESSIIEFGLHNSYIANYLDHLIYKIYNIIPIEQHYRTPIFFHATAGLRILEPNLQSKLLSEICQYFISNTDFYFPDCSTHANILDGDIEGLYSWITLNYLINNNTLTQFNDDSNLKSSFYGLLELGGGSAQICFQNFDNNENLKPLINLQLDNNYQLYSTSFLGFGLNQIYEDYLDFLIKNSPNSNIILYDPCLPKSYSASFELNNKIYNINGLSDFNNCKLNIYSQIINNINKCEILNNDLIDNQFQISNCMLNSIISTLNLNTDDFIAISGYWDIIMDVLNFCYPKNDDEIFQFDKAHSNSFIYNPQVFINATIKICESNLESLQNLNIFNNSNNLSIEEISNLCFKATYISSLLHSGFGLSIENENHHLLLNDKINNFGFSWTLGRALLYAADESTKEYNEFTNNPNPKKIGYSKNLSPNLFFYGSEQINIPRRPDFELKENYPIFKFNTGDELTKTINGKITTTTAENNILDYYDDFDSPLDDKDSKINSIDDNYGYTDNDNDNDNYDPDDIETVYQSGSNPNFLHISLSLIVIISLLLLLLSLIPKTRKYLIHKINKILRKYEYSKINTFNSSSSSSSSSTTLAGSQNIGNLRKFHIQKDSNVELENLNGKWDVNDNSHNDVVSDSEFNISDDPWDNDSDGIERAV
jgi:hypothetical protein